MEAASDRFTCSRSDTRVEITIGQVTVSFRVGAEMHRGMAIMKRWE